MFNKDRTRKDGLSYSCKNCKNITMAAYRVNSRDKIKEYVLSQKNDFHTLYYLPEEHYIGITCQPRTRMRLHKSHGNHILDYETVATFKTKREALDAERYLHSIGYN